MTSRNIIEAVLTDDVNKRGRFFKAVVIDRRDFVVTGVFWTSRSEIQTRDVDMHICNRYNHSS